MTPHALAMTHNPAVLSWVGEIASLTQASEVAWCEGSACERRELVAGAALAGTLLSTGWPSAVSYRGPDSRVCGLDRLVFVCTPSRAEVSRANNWMSPRAAYKKMRSLTAASLRSGTLYVVPHMSEPQVAGAPEVGISVTNAFQAILGISAGGGMGRAALQSLGQTECFSRGFHVQLSSTPTRLLRFHFPEDRATWTICS